MILCGSLGLAKKLLRRKIMASEIFQCWSCKSVLHVGDLDGEDCPFCCTDNNLIDIDNLSEDREDR
tara:strand:- start:271 stop:468 length:198 start_codon:yes stop_codon:yes gene_type:complete